MREVAVIATGLTAFGAFPETTIRELGAAAGRECLAAAGVEADRVDGFYLGCFAGPSFTGQNHLAPWVASAIGVHGAPATRFEAACASSGAAFAHAWAAVAGGLQEMALVVGAEQMTVQPTARTAEILAAAGDVADEAALGATFPALFALIARRHMHEWGTTREHLAAVAVKNHANGLLNPKAHLRKAVTLEKALTGRMICDPLTLYDCSLISDGAAALLLAPVDTARGLTDKPVRVLGVAQASDRLALADKADATSFPAVRAAAQKAFAMAGVGPDEIDVAELHDCFTIAELVALEDLGLFPRGQAGPATLEGRTALAGDRPINPSGGLKSKGHPVGATGAAQVVEIVRQLRGESGERQIAGARLGLTQNLGGSGASCVVGVFGA
ncbi:MAG: thiolase domain-containing protein [Acidobacteria bacterium]|nr:thiolase domain-containing protein [Acidobacteriota bacterium]